MYQSSSRFGISGQSGFGHCQKLSFANSTVAWRNVRSVACFLHAQKIRSHFLGPSGVVQMLLGLNMSPVMSFREPSVERTGLALAQIPGTHPQLEHRPAFRTMQHCGHTNGSVSSVGPLRLS